MLPLSPREWMPGSVGVSVHWTALSAMPDGSRGSFADAVNGFDAASFADALADAGASHCIFTLAHAKQYLALPCGPLESLLPGRTTRRDLIGDLIGELAKRDIRFIAYYNHSCNGNDDAEWKTACGYAAGIAGDLDAFAANIRAVVSFIARRYGDSLAGWWFDSGYSVDHRGPHDTVSTDLGGWLFPWESLTAAARSGHAACAVSVNAGVGQRYLYTQDQDYYAGEAVRLDEPFDDPLPAYVDHRWITLDNPAWVYSGGPFQSPRFETGAVRSFIAANRAASRMTTFNLEIDRSGRINPASLAQVKAALS